jgi:tRNA-dihydrouridine synthase B
MIKLGPIELKTDLLLAPMMDITTPSFRQLIYDVGGAGMMVTPMVFVQQVAQVPKTVLPQLELLESQKPCAIQIVASGRNEAHIRDALDFLNSFKLDMLDINAGCPAAHTMKSGGGGALIRDYYREEKPSRLEKIISSVLKYSDTPVSVKTRLGYSRNDEILEMAQMVNKSGAAFLTIHGRTVGQKYGGVVDLEILKKVKDSISIPLIGNGDVVDYDTYKSMKDITGCDAVMIGRAATFDPAIFLKIQHQKILAQNQSDTDISEKIKDKSNISTENGMKLNLLSSTNTISKVRYYLHRDLEIVSRLSRFWNKDRFALAEMRRLGIWLIKGIKGYKKVRERLSKIPDIDSMKNYLFGDEIEKDFMPKPNI